MKILYIETSLLIAIGFTVSFFLVLFLAIYLHVRGNNKRKADLMILKEAYNTALAGDSKQAALAAGRKYYARTRASGRLTTYDEQALSNDINAMKTI